MSAARNDSQPETNTRLTVGNYIADVLLDTRPNSNVYHWIVQKVGSAEIVYWGQERTFKEAKTAAESCLEGLRLKSTHDHGLK